MTTEQTYFLTACFAAAVVLLVEYWTRDKPQARRLIFGLALGALVFETIRQLFITPAELDRDVEPRTETRTHDTTDTTPEPDQGTEIDAKLERRREDLDSLSFDDLRDELSDFDARARERDEDDDFPL